LVLDDTSFWCCATFKWFERWFDEGLQWLVPDGEVPFWGIVILVRIELHSSSAHILQQRSLGVYKMYRASLLKVQSFWPGQT
jgi:hypothetical protein